MSDDNEASQTVPADDTASVAAAAAEVDVMDGHHNARNTRRAAEEAVLGVQEDGVEAYMAHDESGLLVEQRFLQFLESL